MTRARARWRDPTRALLLVLSAVASSLLLPDCALKDDYYVRKGEAGRATAASGEMDVGGEPAIALVGSGGMSSAGAVASAGAMSSAGADGDAESGLEGCVSATSQEHAYAFCFTALIQAAARADCGARGMTLAVIDDPAENVWITATLSSLYRGESALAFIGANDVAIEGEWRRADGVIFWRGGAGGAAVSGNYANWDVDQPSDPGTTADSEDCLTIGVSSGAWNDMSCDTELPYVCEPR